jgi:hypothetical protein
MNRDKETFFRRVLKDESAAAAILVALGIFALVGLGALSVDVGYLFAAQRALQASTNAAAMAGAQDIGVGGTPVATATSYSSVTGNKNADASFTATMAAGYPKLWCFNTGGVCTTNQTPATSANGILVQQQATVPLYFGRIFGISSVQLSAEAVALAAGGVPQPLNVAFILDTTASMGGAPAGAAAKACSGFSTSIECAADGVQTLLGELWPCASNLASCGAVTKGNVANPVDETALFVFPPVTNASQATADIGCTNPKIATSYSGVSNTTSAATTTSTLALQTSMTAANAFNTGATWAMVTDAGTPVSSATATVLTFPSGVVTTHITAGMTIQDTTTPSAIPSGTTVSSISVPGKTVTMSKAGTVKSNDLITFGTSIPAGTGSWPWWGTGTSISSVTLPTTAVMSANPTGPGVLQGDTIIVAPLYQIVGFSSDYRTSDTATTLYASSNIVQMTAKGCLGTPGGLGTFYADAITAAQSSLVAAQNARIAAGQPGGTNVIVLLSDGAATSSAAQMGPLKTTQVNQECHQAITAAQAAATAGTWVYAIYYDDGSTTCSDTTTISSCTTMQSIASDPTKFYSTDGTAGPCVSKSNYTTVSAIFQAIGYSLTTARLLPSACFSAPSTSWC